ncbi:MAG: hypothetical protein Q8R38_07410 [Candidatus Omnitrophota bacterium]|nr:hypothetical protein [Candidatus Omnitrophota bacterium]
MIITSRKAHSLTELLIASVIVVFLFISAIGAFMLTQNAYSDSIATYNLQRDINIALATMIRGVKEPAGTFGLRSGAPSSTTPAMPSTEIQFIQPGDDPPIVRKFFLTNNTIVYESPTQNPTQKVIYTPPGNSNVTLTFSEPSADEQLVTIYVSVLQQRGGRSSVGSVTTNVNLRNTPK